MNNENQLELFKNAGEYLPKREDQSEFGTLASQVGIPVSIYRFMREAASHDEIVAALNPTLVDCASVRR